MTRPGQPPRKCHDCRQLAARGSSRCDPCLLRHRNRRRAVRGDRRSEAQCPDCGRAPEPGYTYCAWHVAQKREAGRLARSFCSACYTVHPAGACQLEAP
jgi:hypothetical protein